MFIAHLNEIKRDKIIIIISHDEEIIEVCDEVVAFG
jgi:ABC-type lipoprotein export system ATPase subunit